MLSCQFCRTQTDTHFLLTVCQHVICLPCCYIETDFSTLQIKCCGVHTTVDRNAMTEIIRNKKPNRKQTEPVHDSNNSYQEQGYLSLSNSGNQIENRCNESRWVQLRSNSLQKSNNSNGMKNKSLKFERFDENQHYPSQQLTFQENSYPKKTSNKKCIDELENILVLQIEKVKKQFDYQHENLRRKEDMIIKQLMSAYEDEIKNIERPIMCAKLQNFDVSMGRFNNRIKQNLRSQMQSQLKQNPVQSDTNCNHYDHIIKKLELNQQRMSEKLQKHLHSLG